MKHLTSFLLVLFLLTGCVETTGQKTPSPEAAEDTTAVVKQYEEAAAVYDWFDLCTPPCTGEPVQADGEPYRQVDVTGLSTYADLEARVRSLFSSAIADEMLSNSSFRDINGKLYCTESSRVSNPDYAGKTISVRQLSEDHFTVELLFWTDHRAGGPNSAPDGDGAYLVGYSRTVLDYEKTDAGFRFTNFCSSDALDPIADTVCLFPDRSNLHIDDQSSDWDVICALLASNSGSFEEIAYVLPDRFLDHPQEVLRQLGLLYDSPLRETDGMRYLSVEQVLTWPMLRYDDGPDMKNAYQKALDTCTPSTPGEEAVLSLLQQDFAARVQQGTSQ